VAVRQYANPSFRNTKQLTRKANSNESRHVYELLWLSPD
jgi:hypothetical protein